MGSSYENSFYAKGNVNWACQVFKCIKIVSKSCKPWLYLRRNSPCRSLVAKSMKTSSLSSSSSGLDALQFFLFRRTVLCCFLTIHQLIAARTARLRRQELRSSAKHHDGQYEAEQAPAHEDHLQTQKPATTTHKGSYGLVQVHAQIHQRSRTHSHCDVALITPGSSLTYLSSYQANIIIYCC